MSDFDFHNFTIFSWTPIAKKEDLSWFNLPWEGKTTEYSVVNFFLNFFLPFLGERFFTFAIKEERKKEGGADLESVMCFFLISFHLGGKKFQTQNYAINLVMDSFFLTEYIIFLTKQDFRADIRFTRNIRLINFIIKKWPKLANPYKLDRFGFARQNGTN